MDDLVRFRARGDDADGDRVEAGVAQPPKRDGRRAVRLEVDRAEPCPRADRDDRLFDHAHHQQRLTLTCTAEADHGAPALEMSRRRIRELLWARTEGGGFRR